jgi:hypothetical protein
MDKYDRALINGAALIAALSISGLIFLAGATAKASYIAGAICFIALLVARKRWLDDPPFRWPESREQALRRSIREMQGELAELEAKKTYRG